MSDRSRSPRGTAAPAEADLRARLDDAEAALVAERANRAAERDCAAFVRQQLHNALNSMTHDIRELAAIARRAGASGNLVDYWSQGQPPPSEPAEPDLRTRLAAAEAALAAAEAELATTRARASESRLSYLSALNSVYRECTELAVLARRAGASGDVIDYWCEESASVGVEPEAEPEPQ
jgi:hypothetical protein